jgi:uncharacterized membrane protein
MSLAMDDTPPDATTEEILAEAERRRASRPQQEEAPSLSPTQRGLVLAADRFIFWLGRHWLALANLGAFLYVGLSFLAPVLMHMGLEASAHAIYALYSPLCHQLPQRSWYLFGARAAYTAAELARQVGAEGLVQHGYIGDAELGYKVALCQRDTAIYGTILLAGLVYGLARRRLRPLSLWAYLLLGVLPIALDGGIQFLSYALPLFFPSLAFQPLESNPLRRAITGALFGLATVWLAYPHAQEAFSDVLTTLEKRFGWKR